MKKTKIICTIGPACESQETLEKMIHAGMNVTRLNFSHGSYDHMKLLIKNIRAASAKTKVPIAILQDLQGPKIRIGKMPEAGILLKKNQIITLDTKIKIGNETKIPLQYKQLPKEVKKNHIIMVNDGLIELKVISKTKDTIKCRVIAPGHLTSNKGINVPDAKIQANPLTAKDLKDLKFGLKIGVDFIALSFVRNSEDIKHLKKVIQREGGNVPVIAKIERREAIENLEEIIETSDGIMVARGDLGLEIPAEQVPIEQKRIIKLCNKASKPVITATQMLNSMVDYPRASRAEISDIANAVLDKTDAVMLSNETAVGKYPVKATETLARVAKATEKMLKKVMENKATFISPSDVPHFDATCLSATQIAKNIRAKYIIAITKGGYTAKEIAKHRAYIPIIAISESPKVERNLQMVWGVVKCLKGKIDKKDYAKQVISLLKKNKLVKKGDEIVICNSSKNQDLVATIQID
ncbi:pyruvate kinase [Patescibacteria group bacterium]|nr:pyruvate kinase [Patescibacteria group bacterium]